MVSCLNIYLVVLFSNLTTPYPQNGYPPSSSVDSVSAYPTNNSTLLNANSSSTYLLALTSYGSGQQAHVTQGAGQTAKATPCTKGLSSPLAEGPGSPESGAKLTDPVLVYHGSGAVRGQDTPFDSKAQPPVVNSGSNSVSPDTHVSKQVEYQPSPSTAGGGPGENYPKPGPSDEYGNYHWPVEQSSDYQTQPLYPTNGTSSKSSIPSTRRSSTYSTPPSGTTVRAASVDRYTTSHTETSYCSNFGIRVSQSQGLAGTGLTAPSSPSSPSNSAPSSPLINSRISSMITSNPSSSSPTGLSSSYSPALSRSQAQPSVSTNTSGILSAETSRTFSTIPTTASSQIFSANSTLRPSSSDTSTFTSPMMTISSSLSTTSSSSQIPSSISLHPSQVSNASASISTTSGLSASIVISSRSAIASQNGCSAVSAYYGQSALDWNSNNLDTWLNDWVNAHVSDIAANGNGFAGAFGAWAVENPDFSCRDDGSSIDCDFTPCDIASYNNTGPYIREAYYVMESLTRIHTYFAGLREAFTVASIAAALAKDSWATTFYTDKDVKSVAALREVLNSLQMIVGIGSALMGFAPEIGAVSRSQ